MIRESLKKLFIAPIFLMTGAVVCGQNVYTPNNIPQEDQLNTITTAVPFLMISPDARSGAMGDAGVATSPDANSIHWNPSKLAFIEGEGGVSFTYSPWLRNLVSDIGLAYLSGYKRINRISTIGGSLRYFSLGEITFTDNQGNAIGNFTPNEWALDAAYGMQLNRNFSFGMALRFVNSNLTNSITVQGQDTRPARSVAADVSAYYRNEDIRVGDYDAILSAGISLSNIGAKMSYTDNDESDFLPTNLRIGPSLELELDQYNSLMFTVEASKLLVPTPPIYQRDSTGTIVTNDAGDPQIWSGYDPEVSVTSGLFQSFYDAPGRIESFDAAGNPVVEDGSVLQEELREIALSAGMEYWYDKQLAIRMGYFYEHPTKGNRQFFTVGLGLKLSVFSFDASYLVGNVQQNPLANTVRFSLKFNFEDFNAQNEEE
ncbi:MAG: type IX secretion system outer membrane channel protein PorV [Vicingaceae bacterium]